LTQKARRDVLLALNLTALPLQAAAAADLERDVISAKKGRRSHHIAVPRGLFQCYGELVRIWMNCISLRISPVGGEGVGALKYGYSSLVTPFPGPIGLVVAESC
jgi:hypothetical protein